MKSSYLSMAIAAGLAIFSPNFANASDLGIDGRADQYEPAPAGTSVNWSGVYVGGAIGYGNANHDLSVQDYFKDFCSDNTSTVDFDPFGDDDREKTLANRIAKEDINNGSDDAPEWTTCSDVDNGWTGNDLFDDAVTVTGDSREVANLDGLNSTGIVGDFRLGYDQQMGRFLFGLFGTYGLSNMDADGSVAGVGNFTLERGDDWSAGARAGVLVNDSTLLYALAAYTQTEYDLTITDGANTLSKTTTFDGITVGGGIELAVTNNVFFGIEGTHTFYDEETIFDAYDADTNVGTSVNDDLGETKILGTLKIKLNSF